MLYWMCGRHMNALRSFAVPIIVALAVTACGGGGGVDLAGGQGADPVVLDVPIAYVKRPLPLDDQGNVEPSDARELIRFEIGADLYVRDRASPSAEERNITEGITAGLGDVRDLEVSYDGTRIIFAMRAQWIPCRCRGSSASNPECSPDCSRSTPRTSKRFEMPWKNSG